MNAQVFRRMSWFKLLACENPRHKEHVTNLIKKYPTAKGNVPKTLILVNPEDWAISLEDPKANTTECCQVCSISEDIIRASSRRNEPDRYCSCQREQV
jgi:hypothetical protein